MNELDKLKFRVKELKHFNGILEQQNLDKAKEIKRLNNIINEFEDKVDTLKIEISSLMSRYFYEEDFYIEDTHLDKLLRIIDNDIELKGDDKK